MKLEKYYEMQAKLDQNIIEVKGLNPKTNLFKIRRIIAFKQEFGELLQRLPEVFKDWSNKKNILDDETLEEWVDGFHFLLSIGNWLGFAIKGETNTYTIYPEEMPEIALSIYEATFSTKREYVHTFNLYYSFIRSLGYTDEQIEASYKKKNAVNFERQENGY